jgi:riboflavin kinase/FMN adenylyltransferase
LSDGAVVFEHRGRVEPGRRLGRLLGAPTANLPLRRRRDPPFGTFAAVVDGLERPYRAVAHVGVRPSVAPGGPPILEVHLLDFDGDLYGRELVVRLEHKVADEVRLASLDALARKVADDVTSVRAYFAGAAELSVQLGRRPAPRRARAAP